MDKTYIKMCDCEEIQANHRWEYGDWLLAEYGVFQIGTASFHYDMGDGSKPPIRSELPIATIQAEDLDSAVFTGEITWLPRQDQLQEMVGCDKNIQIAHHRLYQIAEFWIGRDLNSMEQLWLAFVMKEKYNKVWNGNEWV